MTDVAFLLTALGRTTLWLAAAGLVAAAGLWMARTTWPTAHRAACLATLLVGWTFLQLPLELPWYDAPRERVDIVQLRPIAMPAIPTDELLEARPVTDTVAVQPVDSTAVPAPLARGAFDWRLVLLAAWLVGVVLLPAAWLVGYVRFVRALTSRVAADEPYRIEWSRLLSSQKVRATIPLSVTAELGPMLCRLPRGYELVVPGRLWGELDAAGREAILRHELAHYLRGDVWKSLAVRLMALPHWFNPLGWWAVRRFDEAAEWACDRAAAGDQAATEYAKVLVRLGEGATHTVYGSAARGRALAGRVRRVLRGTTKEDSTMKKSLLIAAGLCLVAMSVVQIRLVAREPEGNGTQQAQATAPAQAAVADEDSKSSDKPTSGQAAGSNAAKRMFTEAVRAYEASIAAFEAETITMQPVYEFSLRWMQAAERLADKPSEKVAAARDHFERMKKLHDKLKMLYEVGVKGGEVQQYAAACFYLAEAERMYAETEAAVALGKDPSLNTSSQASRDSVESQRIDLKIKIAELRGQVGQAKAQLKWAKTAADLARQVASSKGNGIDTRAEILRPDAECAKLEAQLDSYEEQLQLYEDKLKLVTSRSEPQPATSAVPTTPGERQLLYDGKDFDQWAEELRTELSPVRRTEAINALAAFARHGKGTQAATEILRAMRGYPISTDERTPESQMVVAAFNALQGIPTKELLPVVFQGLKSDDVAERHLSAYLLNWFASQNSEASAQLENLLKDRDLRIRLLGASRFLWRAAEMPAVVEVFREALASSDPQIASDAQASVRQFVINKLGGSAKDSANVVDALKALGPAVIPAIESATIEGVFVVADGQNQEQVKQRKKELLELLRAQQAKEASK